MQATCLRTVARMKEAAEQLHTGATDDNNSCQVMRADCGLHRQSHPRKIFRHAGSTESRVEAHQQRRQPAARCDHLLLQRLRLRVPRRPSVGPVARGPIGGGPLFCALSARQDITISFIIAAVLVAVLGVPAEVRQVALVVPPQQLERAAAVPANMQQL